jgi:MYXO-CTERM domain-containing protein
MAVGIVVVALAAPDPARACGVSEVPASIDPSLKAVDHSPPVLPSAPTVEIKRGHGPTNPGCSGGSDVTSCDDLGELLFTVAGTDDMTPTDHLGYSFSLASGKLPEGFTLPATPLQAQSATSVVLFWVDGAIDGQEPLDFTLRVVAVDGAGNESASQLVSVQSSSTGDCRVGGTSSPSGGAAAFVGAAAVALAARRRSRTIRPRLTGRDPV